jgi:hypothetical protein
MNACPGSRSVAPGGPDGRSIRAERGSGSPPRRSMAPSPGAPAARPAGYARARRWRPDPMAPARLHSQPPRRAHCAQIHRAGSVAHRTCPAEPGLVPRCRTRKSSYIPVISADGDPTSGPVDTLARDRRAASRHPGNENPGSRLDIVRCEPRSNRDVTGGRTRLPGPRRRPGPAGSADAGKTKVWPEPRHVSKAEYAFSVARNYRRSRISQVPLGSAGRQRNPFSAGQAGPYGPTVIMKFPGFVMVARNWAKSFYPNSAEVQRSFCHDLSHAHEYRARDRGRPAISPLVSWGFTGMLTSPGFVAHRGAVRLAKSIRCRTS